MTYASMINMPCIAVDWQIALNPIYGMGILFVANKLSHYEERAIMHDVVLMTLLL